MFPRLFRAALLAAALVAPAGAQETDLYRSSVIVSGTEVDTRVPGFRECIPAVLLRVSGDQRLLENAAMEAILSDAEAHVASVRYRDRHDGQPVHDDQGSYDRPHDLTCLFEPAHVDELLAQLGSRPWPLPRPGIEMFVHVVRGDRRFVLTADGSDGLDMREAVMLSAEPLALDVALPVAAAPVESGFELPTPDAFVELAERSGGRAPLAMTLEWSDSEPGWIARYRMVNEKGVQDWNAHAVSFDQAFRIGLRGAAQILSGNGAP